MTEKQVQDALLSHLSAQLIGTYPTITTAYSLERAGQLFEAETPFIAATPQRYEYLHPDLKQWEFLVQFSRSTHQDENTTASGAIEADRDLIVAVQNAITTSANYRTLRDAGLMQPRIRAMGEDQRDLTLINPHVFSCITE